MLHQTEAGLIRQLQDSLPASVEVCGCPENREELRRPFDDGRVLVVYGGGKSAAPRDASGAGQYRSEEWMLVIQHAKRSRLIGLVDAVTLILTGFRPPGAAGRMRHVADSSPEVLDATWSLFQTWHIDAALVPLADPQDLHRFVPIFTKEP
ncbi:Gp37 domain containing protein [Laribacter hongkongensis HLHK9]|uniref:Gp37 domain containing protein n=1 Tax=Laribacter hongkongensis (strain HLHK9) TaxID=557598 RepID=C1D844_LARHH|nr:Gp37 family protein [Laribacter hongkongensis]ACO74634.1 Gp37 domain containing protein [Laribacter hongkongensis HLHK9]